MLDGKVFTIYKYNSNDEYGPDDIIAENVVEWIADKDYTVEDYDMDTVFSWPGYDSVLK